MLHEEKDTLDLLGKYSQKKEPIKTYPKEENAPVKEKIIYRSMGAFKTETKKSEEKTTKEKNKFGIPNFIWYSITALMIVYILREIYFINLINNAGNEVMKMNNVMMESTNEMIKSLNEQSKKAQQSMDNLRYKNQEKR